MLVGALATGAHAQSGDDLTKLRAQVEVLWRAGKHADALPLAERAVKLAEETYGLDDKAVGGPLLVLGRLYEGQHRYADAEALFKRGLAIYEKALGPDHASVGTALNDLARLYRDQGRYADAEPLFRRSLAIYEKALGPDHASVGTALISLAALYRDQGRYADAEPLFKRSLAIYEKALGPDHPNVATSLISLAVLYRDQGRYADAEPLLKRGLALYEKMLGPDHTSVGTALNNLAVLYRFKRRYADAEPLFKRSLAIHEKALGPDHPSVGTTLGNLAGLYRDQGRYAVAEQLYERSLAIFEKALGPDHPRVGVALNNLAQLYQARRRRGDVEPLFKRSLAIAEKALGAEHPNVARIAGDLGNFLKSEGRLAEAEPLLKRALEAAEKALAPTHRQVIGATVQLAELYGLQGRAAEARALFARAGADKTVDLQEFPIYFGTNRKQDPKQKRIAFGSERDLTKLTLGVVKVVVPPAQGASGDIDGSGKERAADLLLNDMRRLAIQPVELASAEKIVRAARERLFRTRAYLGQALVYVHGYNTDFENAVRRAAQLAYDLGFDGPVFAFSWPSHGRLAGYLRDGDSARLFAPSLRELLETVVAETKAKRVHIIAHSMGSEVLNTALSATDLGTLQKLNIGEMVLASPDLDPDIFDQTFGRLRKLGTTSTTYASSRDWALWLSGSLRFSPRLGYIPSKGPKRLIAGNDLIDISAVNSDVFNLNHDTYANSPDVIADLKRLLKEGQRPPEARTIELRKLPAVGGTYWRYKAYASEP